MKLIDADALREHWLTNGENEYIYDTNAFLDSIDEQPTVDAVEVVHAEWLDGWMAVLSAIAKRYTRALIVPIVRKYSKSRAKIGNTGKIGLRCVRSAAQRWTGR